MGKYAKDYLLDGVDYDFENPGNFAAVGNDATTTINWWADLVSGTRSALGKS